MKTETSIKLTIDADFLAEVETESFRIVWQQRRTYNQCWQTGAFITQARSILRLLLLGLSLLGVVLSLSLLVYPSACPRWFYAQWFLLFFILTAIFAYFMPRLDVRFHKALSRVGEKGCKRMARRFVKKALKQIPFEAEYVIRGDSVTYYRRKEERWNQIWSRRIKGFAIQSDKVTLLFRKPTSLVPYMLVMHEDRQVMESVLKELGIAWRADNSD